MAQRQERRLAAIMFADMVGYTALMQEDEDRARSQRDRHRAILGDAVAQHNGTVLEYYGDGSLSLFNSAVEAVECSVAVQHALQGHGLIPLRIGVHTGDIVREEAGVYGDSVNVASRIEGLAAPGGVMVSAKVMDEIKNHPSILTRPMGEVPLKNVGGLTPVFAIANEGLAVPTPEDVAAKAGSPRLPTAASSAPPANHAHGRAKAVIYASTVLLGLATIAVLATVWPGREAGLPEDYVAVFPFRNLTGDAEFDDLGAAAAYLITDGLSRVDEVRGVATSTVEQTLARLGGEGTELAAAEVLGAGTAVTGVLTRSGDSLRLSAQITRVSTGEALPGVSGVGSVAEPVAAVDALGRQVLSALALAVDTVSGPFISRPPSYEALRLTQRGFTIGVTGDRSGALEHFHRAYAMDSTFLTPLIWATGVHGIDEEWARADSILQILIARREEMSPGEQLQVEFWIAEVAGDLQGGYVATQALARNDPRTWGGWHAETALIVGRPDEAVRVLEGVDLEWESASGWAPIWSHLANANYALGRYREALDAARRGREWFPEVPVLVGHEVRALLALERMEEIGPLLDELEGLEPAWDRTPASILLWLSSEFQRRGLSAEGEDLALRAEAWSRSRDPDGFVRERAHALILAHRPAEAVTLLRPVVEAGADDAEVHGLLGVAAAMSGDTEAAEAEARWCADLDRPYLRGIHTYWRAAILAHLEQTDEAIRVRRQAYEEGQSYFVRGADGMFRPLWGVAAYERLVG